MNKFTPFVVPLAIIIGLFTMIYSVNHLLDFIKPSFNQNDGASIVIKQKTPKDSIVISLKSVKVKMNQLKEKESKYLSKKITLNRNPSILVWINFHSIVLALASAAIIFIIMLIINLKTTFNVNFKSKKTLIEFIPFFIILIVLTWLYIGNINSQRETLMSGVEMMKYFDIIFANPKGATRFVLVTLTVLGVIPLIGIVMINVATNTVLRGDQKDVDNKMEERYKMLKSYLNLFALYSGLLVASTIIGIKLQRNMIAEQVQNIEKIYPDQFIYTYGIAYTFILAFFFLPTLINLKYVKQSKQIKPKEIDKNTNWWKIGEEAISDIKLVFSIILPLITSLFQSFG